MKEKYIDYRYRSIRCVKFICICIELYRLIDKQDRVWGKQLDLKFNKRIKALLIDEETAKSHSNNDYAQILLEEVVELYNVRNEEDFKKELLDVGSLTIQLRLKDTKFGLPSRND